jgi:hypothetical protein
MNAEEARRSTGRGAAFFRHRWCPERAPPQMEVPTMIKSLPFAAALALAATLLPAGPAAAMRFTNQGEQASVEYDAGDRGNILGGGSLRIEGQGESQRIAYDEPRLARPVPGLARAAGGSEGEITYLPLDTAQPMLARR